VESANFIIEERAWETDFFKKKTGLLKCKSSKYPSVVSDERALILEADLLLLDADKIFELLEFNVKMDQFLIIPLLEDLGFRLVDSRISFKTRIDVNERNKQNFELSLPGFEIRSFAQEYLQEVLSLTDKYLANNPDFVSRYKNTRFFSSNDASKYFQTWIKNTFRSEKSISCVLIDQKTNQVKGYFIYEKISDSDALPTFKGILTVIDEEARGHSTHLALQSYLFSLIPDQEFFLDNTTQLTNTAVIRNHLKSFRNLESISLTFIRKRHNNDNTCE
jgi:hypothetical protein